MGLPIGGDEVVKRVRRNHAIGTCLLVGVITTAMPALQAFASCDVIPGTLRIFRGSLGSLDRPFARPGDFVTLRLNSVCASSSPGFAPTAADHVVSVVFTPPGETAANHVVLLAADCPALEGARLACEQRSDVASATCIPVNGPGDPSGIEVVEAGGERRLRFRFPDTDSTLPPDGDHRTLAGPAKIAVTGVGEPLPCAIASSPCSATDGTIACVDELYAINGTCDAAAHAEFSHFTALPPTNDYQAVCFDPSPPCLGTAPEIRFTTDRDGNVLLPVDWRGVLIGDAVPVARLVRASARIEAFAGSGEPIRVPGEAFLRSFSPGGGTLPPIFDPQTDPFADGALTLFGTADAPETVLRIRRRADPPRACADGVHADLPCFADDDCPASECTGARCNGGPNDGSNCTSDADCPDAECGPGLFELRDRYTAGVGPVVVPRFAEGVCQAGPLAGNPCSGDGDCAGERCVAYRLEAADPVPLEGLNQTASVNGFVLAEAIVGRDLNGDGDTNDSVVLLADRDSGQVQAIGSGGAEGRAVARLRQAPFSYPAVALEGDVVAFLEPETAQAFGDHNGNGRIFDTLLRVHRLGPVDRTPIGTARAVDAAPRLDGRPLRLSQGHIFVRTSEAALAAHKTERVSLAADGSQADRASTYGQISADGRWAIFESEATNLVTGDTNGRSDVFARDLLTGSLNRVSLTSSGTQIAGASLAPSVSGDGRYVVFQSDANGIVPGDTANLSDIFVRDRDADEDGIFDETGPGESATERISVSTPDVVTDLAGAGPPGTISPDGRFVAFGSIVSIDGTFHNRMVLRDRTLQTTEIVSLRHDGSVLAASGSTYFEGPAMSADGRFIAFRYNGSDAVPNDTNGRSDIFLRDRLLGTTERVSLADDGSESDGEAIHFSLSDDGRYVAFSTWATNLVAGDTNGARDVFVRDRLLGRTERVSVGSAGEQGFRDSEEPRISADGRFVAFRSAARGLVPDTTHDQWQYFLRDRLLGTTARLTNQIDGSESAGGGFFILHMPTLSADATIALFHTNAADLVPGDTNTFCDSDPTDGIVSTDQNCADVYVRRPDPNDPLGADLSGDGSLDDTLLEVVDAATGDLTTLCPAEDVSVADGRAVFLRPEAAGATTGLPHCPSGTAVPGGVDLNADGDAADAIVHLWSAQDGVANLGCAATQVWLSASHVAALLPENASAAPHNGDGDTDDSILVVRSLDEAGPAACDDWTPVGDPPPAATTAQLVGTRLAFLASETAQSADLNGDGDTTDQVLHLHDAAGLTNTGRAAADFVLGSSLLAVRVPEAAQGATDLNDDGDTGDAVLEVIDLATGQRVSSGQAAVPCSLEACDPRLPYRVLDDTVKFLTFEPDQGEDLNGNGSTSDLVLQVFNVRLAQEGGTQQRAARHRRDHGGVTAQPLQVLGVVSGGICTNGATACATDTDCPGGSCFVPPGGCIRDLGNSCSPSTTGSCGAGAFCQPQTSTCFEVGDACESDLDCPAYASCSPKPSAYRLLAPLAEADTGGEIFVGAGRCLEPHSTSCSAAADCSTGEACFGGLCGRIHGVCAGDADCPTGAHCELQLTTSTARDTDHDELADPHDNCPAIPNIRQADADGDGIGDVCQCSATASLTSLAVAERVGRPGSGKLKLKTRDAHLRAPAPGSADDPRIAGGQLTFSDPATGGQWSFDLPAAGWSGFGIPEGARGYSYRDTDASDGPCTSVKLQLGNSPRLQVTCRGATLPIPSSDQSRLLVQLALGAERTCMTATTEVRRTSLGAKLKGEGARPATWPPP